MYSSRKQGIDQERVLRLIAVIETGSFSAAAECLGITQPTLSASISQLERDVGLRLLDRGARGAHPTVYGTLLYERAKNIQEELARAANDLADLASGRRGRLVVGTNSGTAAQVACTTVTRMIATRPDLQIQLQDGQPLTDMVTNLKCGVIDLFVSPCGKSLPDPELQDEHLISFPRVFVTRSEHPLAQRAKPSIADLAACAFVYPDPGEDSYDSIVGVFERLGIAPPRIGAVVQSLEAAKLLIMGSDLCAILPRVAVASETKLGLVRLYDFNLPLHKSYRLVRNARRTLSPTMAHFIDEFRLVCDGLAWSRN